MWKEDSYCENNNFPVKVIFSKFEMFQNMKTKNATFQVPLKREVPWSLSWNADLSADLSADPSDELSTADMRAIDMSDGLGLDVTAGLSADVSADLESSNISAAGEKSSGVCRSEMMVASVSSDLMVNNTQEGRVKKARRGPEHDGADPVHVSPGVKFKMRPPIKPASSFSIFVKQHKTALRKKGLNEDEAMNEAVKKWRNLSPAVKNKYQDKYLKMKASYEIKLKGFEDKIKVRKERFEQQKGTI